MMEFYGDTDPEPPHDLNECCMGYGDECPVGWKCPSQEVDPNEGTLLVLKAGITNGLWGGPRDGWGYVDPEWSRTCWVCEEWSVHTTCRSCYGSICKGCSWESGLCTFCSYLNQKRQTDI